MKLNTGQTEAIRKAIMWYYDMDKERNIFIINGGPGRGKTFIIRYIIDMLNLRKYQIIFATFTGKAASLIRSQGNAANTIHKSFYFVKENGKKISFIKRKKLAEYIKLIVLDELSMINNKIMEDILSYGIPVIALGDIDQLPPIYGSNSYLSDPDYTLTEVMRQKEDSGILRLADLARYHKLIPVGTYNESKVVNFKDLKDIHTFDVIICWKNSTRRELNDWVRKQLKYTSILPARGEKLLCLKNDYTEVIDYELDIPIYLVNGMALDTLSSSDDINDTQFKVKFKPDFVPEYLYYEPVCNKQIFLSYRGYEPYPKEFTTDDIYIDFGYAWTCHKSQGSQAERVLVLDEFRGDPDIYAKWLYTAITRASKEVTIAYM